MNDIGIHLVLFGLLSAGIVLIGAFFTEQDDNKALHSFPQRFLVFIVGCGVLTGVLLIFEHTFAAVS
ncbi:MAG: hypothetical protein ACI8X5_002184 [Planctomycetota bacterium]|jgi:hypothetical protein